jgi:hypothetical protein
VLTVQIATHIQLLYKYKRGSLTKRSDRDGDSHLSSKTFFFLLIFLSSQIGNLFCHAPPFADRVAAPCTGVQNCAQGDRPSLNHDVFHLLRSRHPSNDDIILSFNGSIRYHPHDHHHHPLSERPRPLSPPSRWQGYYPPHPRYLREYPKPLRKEQPHPQTSDRRPALPLSTPQPTGSRFI